jgi:hypothetical protein
MGRSAFVGFAVQQEIAQGGGTWPSQGGNASLGGNEAYEQD